VADADWEKIFFFFFLIQIFLETSKIPTVCFPAQHESISLKILWSDHVRYEILLKTFSDMSGKNRSENLIAYHIIMALTDE